MKQKFDLNTVFNQFNLDSKISEYGDGHINDTYISDTKNYILQRINTSIFKNPEELMQNIENVTEFLRKKIAASGGNPDRETLTVIKTLEDKNFYKLDDENYFRVYKFITDTKSINNAEKAEDLYHAGKGFGRFQSNLDDFPADTLFETIQDFHNTPKRLEALKQAVKDDIAGRAKSVMPEIEFALSVKDIDLVTKGLADGSIPLRVTHNDTKINNILFDHITGEAVCVIDLDTVMPGSMLYDFGDALRIGASTAAEDETDMSRIHFNEEYFEQFTKGYFEEMLPCLTQSEIALLPYSAKLLTYECGIRFLTDYLNGDTYFKIHRKHHNLDRARNQFELVRDIDRKADVLNKIVEKYSR